MILSKKNIVYQHQSSCFWYNGEVTTAPVLIPSADIGELTVQYKYSIAFASDRDNQIGDVFIIENDGGNRLNLYNSAERDRAPTFSTDSSHVLFEANRNGSNEIFLMDMDGDNPHSITPDADDEAPMLFSAEGGEQINLTNNPATDTWALD